MGLGPSREACSALSCSYCMRAATLCLMALTPEYVPRCGALGVIRAVLGVVCHVHPVPGLVYVKEGDSV